ncbi:MAG TPA: hypothetical protein HA230_02520 [Candidatus Aenigmarchaeota archaeon]|nr:hypothetical protein [Candidatus Aenigmarchaeota archaeon]
MKKLTKEYSITKSEKKKYVMSTSEDYEILQKVKKLEKRELTKDDKILIKLVRTQLEREWRKHLIIVLNKILRKTK